jgi:hypothetical protein
MMAACLLLSANLQVYQKNIDEHLDRHLDKHLDKH